MNNKVNQILIGFISLVLLIFFCNLLKGNFLYFIKNKEAQAVIINYDSSEINIKYFNEYINDSVELWIKLDEYKINKVKSFGDSMIINYSKFDKEFVYLKNINEPRKFIIFFYSILCMFTIISLVHSLKVLFRKS